MKEYSPVESFERAISHWRVVVILMIVGGLCGLIFHRIQPPLYDATAVFTIGIDFKNVGKELTQYEEDMAVGAAGGLILSTDLMAKVVAQANAEKIQIDMTELKRISSLERRQALWELRVRSSAPMVAQRLANIWADLALADLQEARRHAWQANRVYDELKKLKRCFQRGDSTEAVDAFCQNIPSQDLEQSFAQKELELNTELQAARGILPALLFDLSQEAELPQTPVAYGANLLVLSGALIGFMVAVIFSNIQGRQQ